MFKIYLAEAFLVAETDIHSSSEILLFSGRKSIEVSIFGEVFIRGQLNGEFQPSIIQST